MASIVTIPPQFSIQYIDYGLFKVGKFTGHSVVYIQ